MLNRDANAIQNTILDVEHRNFRIGDNYNPDLQNRSKSIIRIGNRDFLDVTKLNRNDLQSQSIIRLLEKKKDEPKTNLKGIRKHVNFEDSDNQNQESNKSEERNKSLPSTREAISSLSPLKTDLYKI